MSRIVPIEILVWKPECSMCLPELDQKTRRAYQIVNDFHGAMLAGKGKETLVKVLPVHALFGPDYTNHHDALMTAIDYPGRRQHLEEHQQLRRKMAEFFKRFKRGETVMTIEFSLFLSDCVGKHLRTTDRQLAEYLRNHENETEVRSQFIKHLPRGLWTPESSQ